MASNRPSRVHQAYRSDNIVKIIQLVYIFTTILCLTPWLSSGMALLCGIILSLIVGNPFADFMKRTTPRLLQASVIGLGAGMNLSVVGQVGAEGIGYTAFGIVFTLISGWILGKLLGVEKNTSVLVAVGTAICGGSAIAAVASTIRAKSHEISVSLVTVFLLNAAALFIFPKMGHYFSLTENQFGLWSALAIHDTSSVVGAAIQYGAHALEVATTVKLARALWIIPVSISIGFIWNFRSKEASNGSKKYPWFILGFLSAAALVTWIPDLQPVGNWVSQIAKKTLVLTLFMIGSGISRDALKQVGLRPFVQGLILWIGVGSATLAAIINGVIQ
jgi:uncharacterized integral membrane protein (TIGR00698 family)